MKELVQGLNITFIVAIVFIFLLAIYHITIALEKISETLIEIKKQHENLAAFVHDIQEVLQKGTEQ